MVARSLRPILLLLVAPLLVAACGSGSLPTVPPTLPAIPTATVFPTVVVDEQVASVAKTGPSWMDGCPTHTGRLPERFEITTVPGGVTADGICETYVQRGPHSDLITFRATWNAGKKYGGKGAYSVTYLVPRATNAYQNPVPKIVENSGDPP